MKHITDGYQPVSAGRVGAAPPKERFDPPPTTEERRVTKTQLQAELRNEILEELAVLRRIIKGRTLGADVCLDKHEAESLADRLQSWAGRV